MKKLEKIMIEINNSWVKGDFSALKSYFHDDFVIFNHQMKKIGIGKKECIESYKKFYSMVTNLKFKAMNEEISQIDNLTIISYDFIINYTQDKKNNSDKGRETYFFVNDNEKWYSLCRIMSS